MEEKSVLTLGIDIGSTSSKAVILRNGSETLGHAVVPLGTGTAGPEQVLRQVFDQTGLTQEQMACTIATGYGRLRCACADQQISELSCHAKGVHFLLPQVRTIIDIGGQDAKALRVDAGGRLLDFQMNDKCAAGTGRFLEVMARVLNVPLEQLGDVSAEAEHPTRISNTCTVFAESEVISHLSSGEPIANIVAGIHASVAKRVAGMVSRIGMEPAFAISGGVALNGGVVRALESELGAEVTAHPWCQLAGALGAALLAWETIQKKD